MFLASVIFCPSDVYDWFIITDDNDNDDLSSIITAILLWIIIIINYTSFKDGAYFCYCAYVLRISRYLGFLWVVPTYIGIFLSGFKISGESRTWYLKRKLGVTMPFSEIIKLQFGEKCHTVLCILLLCRIIVALIISKKCVVTPNFPFGFQYPLLRSAFPA